MVQFTLNSAISLSQSAGVGKKTATINHALRALEMEDEFRNRAVSSRATRRRAVCRPEQPGGNVQLHDLRFESDGPCFVVQFD